MFHDDSREIAAEYQDGLTRYAAMDQDPHGQLDDSMKYEFTDSISNAPALAHQAHQALPPIQSVPAEPEQANGSNAPYFDDTRHQQPQPHQAPDVSQQDPSQFRPPNINIHQPQQPSEQGYEQANGHNQQRQEEQSGARDLLNTPEETLYMQVFVEEVGAWMDSMDSMKHVSKAKVSLVPDYP